METPTKIIKSTTYGVMGGQEHGQVVYNTGYAGYEVGIQILIDGDRHHYQWNVYDPVYDSVFMDGVSDTIDEAIAHAIQQIDDSDTLN